MGVKQLWELLAPTGNRVEIETLAGKRVAVDASIWLVQFIKAMRDERTGEVVKNAHLLGFFRRITRLLSNRVRPVFVFDGATPALKRQTVAARRQRRQHADGRLKRAAEKMLLHQLREHDATQRASGAAAQPLSQEALPAAPAPPAYDDALGAGGAGAAAAAAAAAWEEEEEEYEGDFGFELPVLAPGQALDMAALAALPVSMQLEFMQRMREQTTASNRAVFAAASDEAPAAFSIAQMDAYIAGGRLKRQLTALVREGAGGDDMRAQRVAGDTTQEFVFDKRAGRDAGLPARAPPPHAPAPAAEQRFAFSSASLHRVLPPPMAGTVAAAAAPPPQPTEAPPAPHVDDGAAAGGEFEEAAPTDDCQPTAVQISFDLPERVDGEDGDDATEWEDVEDDIAAVGLGPASVSAATAAAASLAAALAREEAEEAEASPPPLAAAEEAGAPMARSRVYKRSHGFLNGRSFDDWDGGAPQEQPAANLEEQRDIALAIQLSLSDAGAAKQPRTQPQSHVVITLLDDDDAEAPAEPAAPALRRRPTSPPRLAPSPVAMLEDAAAGAGGGGGEDAEFEAQLRLAVAASLGSAPLVQEAPPVPVSDDAASAEVVVLSQGAAWQLSLNDFAALAANLSHHWPPWLPSPLDLEDQPVQVRCAAKKWAVDTPMEESLMGIAAEARAAVAAAAARHAQPPPRMQAPKAVSMPPPPPRPAPMPTPSGAPQWGAQWENVASVWRAPDAPPAPPPRGPAPGGAGPGRAATAEEEAELRALDAEARADAEAQQAQQFAAERAALQAEHRSAARAAESVTPEMYTEVQEMLTMFGIPFLIAPAEAEAQCAWLDAAGLVDGVVTDDSDVFLFGARTVYRNIFDAKKYVEVYRADDIQQRLGLDRPRLALLALLLGSDYTAGVQGVGPVNAAEIVGAFPSMDALCRFKAWLDAPESDLVADAAAKMKGRGAACATLASPEKTAEAQGEGGAAGASVAASSVSAAAAAAAAAPPEGDGAADTAEEKFKKAHRGKRKVWTLAETFPAQNVVNAYLQPAVDKSRSKFEWGRPDASALRLLCRDTLGWHQTELEKILDRLVTQYDVTETQRTVNAFFAPQQREQAFAKVRSKRLQKAIAGLTGREDIGDLAVGDLTEGPAPKKARKARAPKGEGKQAKKKASKPLLASSEEDSGRDDDEYMPRATRGARGRAAAAATEGAAGGVAEVIVLGESEVEDDAMQLALV